MAARLVKTLDARMEVKDMLSDATDYGTFVGFASVYGNVDRDGEVVAAGAFTKTIGERGGKVKILWQHDKLNPIGTGVVEDTPLGLKITAKLSLGTEKGREAYTLLRDGVLDAMSIGYDVLKQVKRAGAIHLTELRLWEVSLVTFPANELAVVTGVKHEADLDPAHAQARALQLANLVTALSHDYRTGLAIDGAHRDVLRDAITTLGALLAPAGAAPVAPVASSTPPDGGAAPPQTEPDDAVAHSLHELITQVSAFAAAAP